MPTTLRMPSTPTASSARYQHSDSTRHNLQQQHFSSWATASAPRASAGAGAIDGNCQPVPRPSTSQVLGRAYGNYAGYHSAPPVQMDSARHHRPGGVSLTGGTGVTSSSGTDGGGGGGVLPGYGFVFADGVDWSRAVPPPSGASMRPPPPPPSVGQRVNAHNPSWIFTYPLPEGHPALESGGGFGGLGRPGGFRASRQQQPQPKPRRAFERELHEHLGTPVPSAVSYPSYPTASSQEGRPQSSRVMGSAAALRPPGVASAPSRNVGATGGAAAAGATAARRVPTTTSTTRAAPPLEVAVRATPRVASAADEMNAAIEAAMQRALLSDASYQARRDMGGAVDASVTRASAGSTGRSTGPESNHSPTPVRPPLSIPQSILQDRPAPLSATAILSAPDAVARSPSPAPPAVPSHRPPTTPHVARQHTQQQHQPRSATPNPTTNSRSAAVRPAGISTSFTPNRTTLLRRHVTPSMTNAGGVAGALSGDGFYDTLSPPPPPPMPIAAATQPAASARTTTVTARRADPMAGVVAPHTATQHETGVGGGSGGGGWQISDFSYDALLRINGGASTTGLSKRQLERYVPRPYTTKVDDATCTVCLEEVQLGAPCLTLGCHHMFHGQCILQWLSRTNQCPTCRFEIPRLHGM